MNLEVNQLSKHYTEDFKPMIVEKVLSRTPGVTIEVLSKEHNISRSSINRWVIESQNSALGGPATITQHEKRPQDWSSAERFQAIVDYEGLDENEGNRFCREKGIYPHHIKQWKTDLMTNTPSSNSTQERATIRELKAENRQLKQELLRKEKALAEAAALLILKKKAQSLSIIDGES